MAALSKACSWLATAVKNVWANRPDNFYRDIWLLVISVLALWAVIAVLDQSDDIQQQRADTIWSDCVMTNQAHDNTIRALDQIIAELPADQRAEAEASRDSTVLLIEALAPKRDYIAVLDEAVPGVAPQD